MNLDPPPLRLDPNGPDKQFASGWKRAFENLWAYVRTLPTTGGGGSGTVTHTTGNLAAHAPVIGNGSADLKTIAALSTGQIIIGQGTGADPIGRTIGNDATLDASGNVTLVTVAVTPGSYTNSNITVDSKGRVTAASNGAAGGTGITIGLALSLPPLAITL